MCVDQPCAKRYAAFLIPAEPEHPELIAAHYLRGRHLQHDAVRGVANVRERVGIAAHDYLVHVGAGGVMESVGQQDVGIVAAPDAELDLVVLGSS